jgi:hypothetical protein
MVKNLLIIVICCFLLGTTFVVAQELGVAPSAQGLTKISIFGWNDLKQTYTAIRVDQDGTIAASSSSTISLASIIGTGTTTVPIAGTPVQLPNIQVKRVFIQALMDNSGQIVVGDSGIKASIYRGKLFYNTQGDWFNVNNLNLLYIDAANNDDGVVYYYEK